MVANPNQLHVQQLVMRVRRHATGQEMSISIAQDRSSPCAKAVCDVVAAVPTCFDNSTRFDIFKCASVELSEKTFAEYRN